VLVMGSDGVWRATTHLRVTATELGSGGTTKTSKAERHTDGRRREAPDGRDERREERTGSQQKLNIYIFDA
jgi:hypothetical protein